MEEKIENLKQKTINGIIWNFVELFGKYGLTLLISLTLARILGPKDYGLIGLTAAFFTIASAIIEGGFRPILIRKKTVSPVEYNTIFYFNLTASILVYIIVFFLSPLIAKFYNEPRLVALTRFIGITFFFNALMLIQQTDRSRKLNFKIQAFITIPAGLVSGGVAIGLALNGLGVWSLAFQMVLGSFLMMVLYWALNGWRPSLVFSWDSFREMFSGGVMFFLASVVTSIRENCISLIVGKTFSIQQLGYYSFGQKIIRLSSENIVSAVQNVTFPALSKIQDDKQKLTQGCKMIIKNISVIIFPLLAALFVLSDCFVQVFLGEKWLPAVSYLKILCVYGAIRSLIVINDNLISVKASPKLVVKLRIAFSAIIILSIVLMVNFGMIAMLWGLVLSNVINVFLYSYFSSVFINYTIWQQMLDLLPTAISSVLMIATVYCVRIAIPADALYVHLFLSVPAAVVSYVVYCYLFKVEAMKQFFQNVGRKYFPTTVRI
ncbi:MAG: lipopolysaccharide biosynthesis protein [Chitinispirillales bacterium]|jgi:O-antigen/teichoic acid export membrane protein|nr:lipopolysaccharide biosynthesis protein [Chitinispirillales bacterium]